MVINAAVVFCFLTLPAPLGLPAAPDTQQATPVGWFFRAEVPEDYKVGIDHNTVHSGKGSGFIQYTVHPMVVHPRRGPSYLLQAFKAGEYRGHRLRVTAYAKGEKLSEGSFLWVQLDGGPRVQRQGLAMAPAPMERTTDWSKYECVLDVPSSMSVVVVGVGLAGRGTIWVDDVRIEVVGRDVATVGVQGKGPWSLKEFKLGEPADAPMNLDFEQ
jgi:hypothetical protein